MLLAPQGVRCQRCRPAGGSTKLASGIGIKAAARACHVTSSDACRTRACVMWHLWHSCCCGQPGCYGRSQPASHCLLGVALFCCSVPAIRLKPQAVPTCRPLAVMVACLPGKKLGWLLGLQLYPPPSLDSTLGLVPTSVTDDSRCSFGSAKRKVQQSQFCMVEHPCKVHSSSFCSTASHR